MVKNTKKDNRTPSVVPEVVITNQPDEGNVRDANTLSREPSRDRSSRSVSISRLKAGDPLRKEMMFVREKSPFEIGENRDIQLASSKAIIDKALIMDVSGGITKVDEYVSLFFSPGCVIDAAVCEDISTQQTIEVVVVEEEEEDERPELVITPLNSREETIKHQETGEIDESKIDLSSVTEESLPLETTEISSEPDIATFASNIDGEVTELSNTDEVNKQEETEELTEIAIEDNIKQESDKTEEEEDEIEEDEEEEEEEEEEETESSSDESYEELVDPSLWRVYDPNSEDPTAWFYKPPEEVTAEPTEKERDEEFRRARLSRRIPIFLTNLTDRAGPLGSDIKLQCTVEGLEMTCKWLKNDQLVERTSRLQTTAIDGLYTLVLKDVEKYDEGVYTIVAKNRGGEVSSSAKVRIYEDPRDRIEIPTIVKIRDYYHHALNDLIIECQIMSKPSWSVPEVTWLKGEDPVTLDNRVRATYEGNEIFQLNIYNPTPDDSGIYTCVAKNSAGEQEITHEVDFTAKVHYIHLPGMHHADKKILTEEELLEKREQDKKQAQVRAALRSSSRPEPPSEPYKEESFVIRDSKNKLTWAGQLHNITAQKDQIVKMICSVNGDQAIIKWQKNGKAIEYDDRVKLLNSGVIGQIMINGVRPRDAGEYVCTAKNNYNEIKTSCVLKVIQLATLDTSPPTFTKAIKEFYDLRANDLVLETQVHGVPNPNIQWYKDDEKIIYDDKLMLNREPNGRYQLRIHKPHIEDCGLYECRANNSDGQSKVKHKVKFSSNETFVHAHRIEHAERFKRLLEEEIEFSSAQNITQEAPQPEVKSREINAESAESPSNDTEVEKGEEEVANINKDSTVTETEQPVEKEPTLPKPKPTIKPRTMPRRRFDEGPTEPFIIRDSKKKLLWESKLKNFTAQEGGSIKLVCIVAGPQPQYKWMKNGKPLVWSKDVINATKAEFGCVKINHASLSDAGEYTAIAKNADSEIECTCKVTVFSSAEGVHTKPTFTRITDYYDIRVNDLILEVQVRGTPTPTLLWERDGRELHNGMDRIMIAREKDGVYKLRVL
ncbi:muscle M-line assembly protein unc-89 isoform X3 [Aedes aegypti]|uniref:Ig-like domain-containing protein n=1 Tax=Aedes aegypti TaxID=7159 RepID=A0A6I8TAK4_AEDAE|nr:muscle M-line assembly protein unc-89 isoform X3 [Aedes aegypti]